MATVRQRKIKCTSAGTKYSNAEFYENLNIRSCQDQSFNPELNVDCLESADYKNKLALFKIKCSHGFSENDLSYLFEVLTKRGGFSSDFQTFVAKIISSDSAYKNQLVSSLYEILEFAPPKPHIKTNLELLRELIVFNEDSLQKRLQGDPSYDPKKHDFHFFETTLLNIDPTVSKDYIVWIFDSYAEGTIRWFEDLTGRLKTNLKAYHENKEKGHLPAIDIIKGLVGLESLFDKDQYSIFGPPKLERLVDESQISQETKREYEDSEVLVVSPLTREASIYWGKGTKWCTADTDLSSNMFHAYSTPEDPLYIILDKRNMKNKYQLHRATRQYMDLKDRPVTLSILAPKFPTIFDQFRQINYFKIDPRIHDSITNEKDSIDFVRKLKIPELDLSNNGFSSSVPIPIEDILTLPWLTSVNLTHNLLTLAPPDLGNLQLLKRLDLSDNRLVRVPAALGGLNQLEHLELYENELQSLPMELGNLKALKVLHLGFNKFNAFPLIVTRLTNLENLILENNVYVNSVPAEIGNLKALKRLSLSNSGVTALPREIGNLAQLTRLEMNGTQLTVLPIEIGDLQNLTFFDLSNSQVSSLPNEIGKLTKLKYLGLAINHLTMIPSTIGNLGMLEELELFANSLSSLPPEIGNLTELQSLLLSDNNLTTLPAEIGNLRSLETFQVGRNFLTVLPPEIGNLSNLEFLDCSDNKLPVIPSELGNLIALKILKLSDNELTSLPSALSQLTNLTTLEIVNNRIDSVPDELGKIIKG
jgi:Leucine-rich repeat (LRR) protein